METDLDPAEVASLAAASPDLSSFAGEILDRLERAVGYDVAYHATVAPVPAFAARRGLSEAPSREPRGDMHRVGVRKARTKGRVDEHARMHHLAIGDLHELAIAAVLPDDEGARTGESEVEVAERSAGGVMRGCVESRHHGRRGVEADHPSENARGDPDGEG